MTRNHIVSVVANFDTKTLVTTPDPAGIMLGDTIQWFSDDGKHEGKIDDPHDDPHGDSFQGTQPWKGEQHGASNRLTAKKRGRFKYRIKVTKDGGKEVEIDPEVIVT